MPDEESIRAGAASLKDAIRKHLSDNSVDVEQVHLDLAFGFCTSHFTQDPAPAAAARALATQLVDDLLVDGDVVSGFAWEFEVWDHRNGASRSATVDRQIGTRSSRYSDLWPRTAISGSAGGHDTEKAIVDIASQVNPGRTVIVLFANSAATVGSGIGENASDYVDTLTRWVRVGAQNKSGASLDVPYSAVSDGSKKQERKLDVVILYPVEWSSEKLTGGSRSEQLAQPLAATEPIPVEAQETSEFPIGPVVAFVLVIAALSAVAATAIRRPRGPVFMRLEERSFPLDQIQPGDRICRIVGKGFPAPTREDVLLGTGPAIVIAEIYARSDKSVEIEAKGRLATVNGSTVNIVGSRYPLQPRGESDLTFDGTVTREGLPPTDYSVDVKFQFFKEGRQNG